MPTCGYLGDLYGQRRMYLLGITLFTLASLASGLAPSFYWLLGSRALQGIGVSPTLPAVMTIISRAFSPAQRGRAVGFWALVNGAGHTLGPPLSGLLTQQLGWRAVFLFSLPLCLLNLLLVWWIVPRDEARAPQSFDFGGAATLTAAALGLMLALTHSARGGWSSPPSIGLWSLTLIALIVFVTIERQVASPFVDLKLFANRHYASAATVIAAQLFCLFGLLLALPVYLIQVQGWNSQTAGLLILPLPLSMALVAPLAGRLADAHWSSTSRGHRSSTPRGRGSRLTCTLGMGTVALVGLAMLGLGSGREQLVSWQQI